MQATCTNEVALKKQQPPGWEAVCLHDEALFAEEKEHRGAERHQAVDDRAVEPNEGGNRDQQEEHNHEPGGDGGRKFHFTFSLVK